MREQQIYPGIRVLSLNSRPDFPLLERAKFLAIWSSNLDEFFQVRVAGLKEQVAHGLRTATPDGMTPGQQLAAIRAEAEAQYEEVSKQFLAEVTPALAKEGVVFSDYSTLDDDDREYLDTLFRELVFPVVTPLAVDPAHPFPYISNLSLNLAIFVRNPETGISRFARVKIPPILPRFVVLPDGERFVPLEQVIAAHLDSLFPGMEITAHDFFRVTRDADIQLPRGRVEDLLASAKLDAGGLQPDLVLVVGERPPPSCPAVPLLVLEGGLGRQAVAWRLDLDRQLPRRAAAEIVDPDDLPVRLQDPDRAQHDRVHLDLDHQPDLHLDRITS